VEKHRFLFLKGPGAAAVAVAGVPAALTGTSMARVASPTDHLAAGASAPTTGACSSTAFAALGDRGGGFHLSGGRPPSLSSSFSSSSSDEFSGVAGGSLVARAAGTPCPATPGAPAAGSSSPSYVPLFLVLAVARRGRKPGPGASVDPIMRRPQSPSAKSTR
jgi:hypothetical protein